MAKRRAKSLNDLSNQLRRIQSLARQRDYYVRVGLNNDQRSEESIARLRAAGMTNEEIGIGGGNGRYALTTG